MAVQASGGAILSISLATPATFTQAGYSALTYIPVGEVTSIGEFGREDALITHMPLSTRGVKKLKGSFNNGQMSPTIALDKADAGQIAMKTANTMLVPVSFKVTFPDATATYLMGLVMMFKPNIGTTDDLILAATTIEIDSAAMVEV